MPDKRKYQHTDHVNMPERTAKGSSLDYQNQGLPVSSDRDQYGKDSTSDNNQWQDRLSQSPSKTRTGNA